jgi:nucleoside-diphosphate-sugar epimerase
VKNKKNILVVGGTGFLGYHICNLFYKKKWNVMSLSQNPPAKFRKLKKIKYLFGDISQIKKINFLKKLDINYVVNCAGYVDHINKNKTHDTHVKGCANLYKIFSKKKLNVFVQLGSASEYGLEPSPQKEVDICKPKDSYGNCKISATKFLQKTKPSFPFVVIRPYQVYGPKQDNNRIIPFVINSCLDNFEFPCSSGNQFRDFLFIDDFVSAVFKIVHNKRCLREIFNIGYGKPIKVKEVIKKINMKIKSGKPEYGKILMRKYEQKKIYPSIKKAARYFNWFPNTPFDKGLNKTIIHYKNLKKKINI